MLETTKSYMENLANSTMSKEAKEDTVRVLDKNYNKFLRCSFTK